MKEFHVFPLVRQFTLHVLKKKRKVNLTLITIIDNCIQGNIRLVLFCPFCSRRQQAKLGRVNVLKYISYNTSLYGRNQNRLQMKKGEITRDENNSV